MSFTFKFNNIFAIAIPAEPAPLITISKSSIFLPASLAALIIPAETIIAVPCWSSWKTGISNSSFNLFSISIHLGEFISSKFIPPKTGDINFTVLTISSISIVSTHIGNASTPANSLNSIDFPSITGIDADAPMFPSPKTAVPSDTTATIFDLQVYL